MYVVCGSDGGCEDAERCSAEARRMDDEFAAQLEEERKLGYI